MRKVIGIGETVLDIIFKDGKPIEAVPGGSTFNAMVSLARAGADTTFITEVGNDRVGAYVSSFLTKNGIDTSCVTMPGGMKTPVSLAFLNERNEAEYSFYRHPSPDTPEPMLPDINADDIVIIGSFYAVSPTTHRQVAALVELAHSRGAIIYYDVNFRPAHRNDVMRITPNLIDNLEAADIVRGSREDFIEMYHKDDPDRVYRSDISFYCKRLIYTNGAQPLTVFSDGGFRKQYTPQSTDTVSTIGAGDNFNAGLIYALLRDGITRDDLTRGLTEEEWDSLICSASDFAADCCHDIYNYISPSFGEKLKTALTNHQQITDNEN